MTVQNIQFRDDCTEYILQRRLYGIYTLETTVRNKLQRRLYGIYTLETIARNIYFRDDCTEYILQRRMYGIYTLVRNVRNIYFRDDCMEFLMSVSQGFQSKLFARKSLNFEKQFQEMMDKFKIKPISQLYSSLLGAQTCWPNEPHFSGFR